MIRQNTTLLRSIWNNEWGKLAYGLFASVTVTLSKIAADQQIRLLVQSNPSVFPSAQQSITVYNIIGLIFVEIGTVIWGVLLYRFLKDVIVGYTEALINMVDFFLIREMLGLSRRPRPITAIGADFASFMAYVSLDAGSIIPFLAATFGDPAGASISGQTVEIRSDRSGGLQQQSRGRSGCDIGEEIGNMVLDARSHRIGADQEDQSLG